MRRLGVLAIFWALAMTIGASPACETDERVDSLQGMLTRLTMPAR